MGNITRLIKREEDENVIKVGYKKDDVWRGGREKINFKGSIMSSLEDVCGMK